MSPSLVKDWILYEDNHLLILDKPAMLLTQDGLEGKDSLETLARRFIKERDEKPGNVYLHAVHRLDKEAFGIVVLAKTSKALTRLNQAMQKKDFSKQYLAIVEGVFSVESGCWEDWISHGSHRAIIGKKEGAKKAKLTFEVLKKGRKSTLVRIDLETGRYHQIRAQSSHRGHPILGDKKYGSAFKGSMQGIALCHHKFSLTHPISKQLISVQSKQTIDASLD